MFKLAAAVSAALVLSDAALAQDHGKAGTELAFGQKRVFAGTSPEPEGPVVDNIPTGRFMSPRCGPRFRPCTDALVDGALACLKRQGAETAR